MEARRRELEKTILGLALLEPGAAGLIIRESPLGTCHFRSEYATLAGEVLRGDVSGSELRERLTLAQVLPETMAALEDIECSVEAFDADALRQAVGQLIDLHNAEQTQEAGIKLLSAADLAQPLPPIPWLCQAFDLAPGAPGLIAGYGYSGKTVVAMDLALSVASGTPLWGRFPVRQGKVIHLDYEQGARLTAERYQRLAKARGVDLASLPLAVAPLPRVYFDHDVNREIARLCVGCALVLVDSYRAACPTTDENYSEARIPLDELGHISEDTGVVPIVLHHSRKPPKEGKDAARMAIRGSGALYDACGSVLVLSGSKGEPVLCQHEKARITGTTAPDYLLTIADVADGDNPRAGLRVTVESAPSEEERKQRTNEELEGRIVEFLRDQPNGIFEGGTHKLAVALATKQQSVSDALSTLLRIGRVGRQSKLGGSSSLVLL